MPSPRTYRALWTTLAAAGLLSACATASGPYGSLAYQRVPIGSTLTLDAPLRIPAGQAHVDLQARGSGEMDPYCILEVSEVAETAQTVEPDVFEIWRVGRSISPSSDWGAAEPVMLASLGVGLGFGGGGWGLASRNDSGPTQLFYKTRFWLRSGRQPNVRLMTCQWDQMTASGAAFARHLTVAEIRGALGDRMTLSIPGEPAPQR